MGGENFEFQDFQNELESEGNEGIVEDVTETEDDELSGAGMHVEGVEEDDEIPEMEKDL